MTNRPVKCLALLMGGGEGGRASGEYLGPLKRRGEKSVGVGEIRPPGFPSCPGHSLHASRSQFLHL